MFDQADRRLRILPSTIWKAAIVALPDGIFKSVTWQCAVDPISGGLRSEKTLSKNPLKSVVARTQDMTHTAMGSGRLRISSGMTTDESIVTIIWAALSSERSNRMSANQ